MFSRRGENAVVAGVVAPDRWTTGTARVPRQLFQKGDGIMGINDKRAGEGGGYSLPQCDHVPAPYNGPNRDEVLALRRQYVSPGLLTYYREPLLVVEGHMQYVFDERGRRYLDAFAGIVTISVGHCHPEVAEKVRAQIGRLQHTTTIYVHPAIGQLAARLAEKMPAGLNVTYFTNSGSEANELAVLSAREYTENTDVVALRNGYHGGTSVQWD